MGQAARTLIRHKYRFKGEFNLGTYLPNLLKLIESGILVSTIFRGNTYISKKSIENFFSKYISLEEALENFNSKKQTFLKLMKRNNISVIQLSQNHFFYPRQHVEKIITEYNERVLPDNKSNKGTIIKGKAYNIENYYTAAESKELLGFSKVQWNRLKKDKKLTPTILGGIRFYPKSTINELKVQQDKLRSKFYTSDETIEILGLQSKSVSHSILVKTRKKMPPLFRGLVSNVGFQYIYPKEKVDAIALEYKLNETIKTFTDNIETFEFLLKNKKIIFNNENNFSIKLWRNFVHNTLRNCCESYETVHYTISRYINCTELLYDALEKKEIYELTSNQINLKLFNENIPVKYQKIFYTFINKFDTVLIEQSKKKLYKFERIKNPNKYSINHKDKSIYDYEDYKKLLSFANNLEVHKKKAIEDVKNHITKKIGHKKNLNELKVFHYDSAWLYVLIHLNNAWRHKDIVRFPKLDLTELSISNINIDWLEKNNLDFEDARRIVTQIMRKDLKTTKTNATNRFFCSRELTLSLATAAVICEIRRNAVTPNYEYIINFNTKRNELPSRVKKNFFQGFIKKFNFENLKMNRSLLSYMYYLLVEKGHSSAALEVAQRLRAHLDFETTNIYIYIPEHELNNLTHQLFIREHFGYIPDLFADIIFGETVSREKRTSEIVQLKHLFGGTNNIENIAGFLNSILTERKSVAEMIINMGIDEATDYMFKLDAQLLPSKEDNIQCLVSVDNCIKKDFKCKNCQLSIPNFYALSSLAENMINRIQKLESLDYLEYKAERTKMANLYSIEMDQWKRAISVFGKDVVYQFIEGGRKFLKEEMEKIPSEKITVSPK